MPNWKKVIVSGSNVSQLNNDGVYLRTIGDGVITSSAQVVIGSTTGFTTFSSSVSTRLTSVEGYTLDNVTDNGSSTTNVITVGGLTVNGNATITGTLTAQQFNTEFVSSSIIFESGSTKFGDSIDDIHSFTGSVKLNTQTAATTDTDKFLVFDTGGEIKYRTGAEVLSDINPGGLVSSSAQLTTEFDTRYINTTGDGVISSSAQISSVVSASFASSGHNFTATGTSEIDTLQLGSLTTSIASFISATSSFVPNNSTNFTIFTLSPLTNEALFIDYVIQDFARNNKRAGNLRFTWNATDTVFDETSTTSIGNTNNFTFSTNNNGTNLNVLVNNTTGQGMSIIFEYKILYIQ
jgi:hypothetical protein